MSNNEYKIIEIIKIQFVLFIMSVFSIESQPKKNYMIISID